MENSTPKNMGKLVANHQIKFIHGRSHAELEVDVNKWLTASLGKYEIKEIKLDFSQSGARLAMIHYYEHIRVDNVESTKADRKANPVSTPQGTRHIAPLENTPMSHNVKTTSPYANVVKNEIDNMKPTAKLEPEVEQESDNRPTIAELIAPEEDDMPADRGDLSQEEINGKYV